MTDPVEERWSLAELRSSVRRQLGSVRVRVVVGYVGLVLVALVIGLLVTRQLLFTRLDRQI